MDVYIRKAVVVRVVDGDTIEVNIDLGFRIWSKQKLRLLGIDAPEIVGSNKQEGLKAKEHLSMLLPVGQSIFVRTQKADSWDRWLADVYIDTKTDHFIINSSVNEIMIQDGLAKKI